MFELGYPSLEALVRPDQPLVRCHQIIEPKQQTDSRLTITIKNRLRLSPLHTKTFAAGTEVPSPPERLPLSRSKELSSTAPCSRLEHFLEHLHATARFRGTVSRRRAGLLTRGDLPERILITRAGGSPVVRIELRREERDGS